MTDEDLIYDGVCPICGYEFIDGFSDLEKAESYDGRICVIEKEGDRGEMLVHIDETL